MTSTYSPARRRREVPPPSSFPELLAGRNISPQAWLRTAVWMIPALVVAFAGFQRRWMADDAYIYVRTVRQILAGNGPVFNAGERVESSTGTLWQWLLVAAGLPGADLATAAVYGGLLLTAVGFALAGIGALRLYGDRAGLPLGSLVLLGLPPVWDFATSGLETGLATCWIAGAWLALSTRSASLVTSLLLGLGPLVRPDLGLVSAVFLAAQWLLVRPTRRGTLAGVASAVALPGAYEIFRAGYYGHLVPLPAVTKEAAQSLWGRGFGYLGDFSMPYLLWVPALLVTAVLLLSPGRWAWRVTAPHGRVPLVPALAPLVAGLLCWLYVIKIGGDFMHGRMLLPGLLLMLLPVFVVPVTRAGALAAVGVGVWAVVCAGWLRIPYGGQVGPAGIADERGVYIRHNADAHPIHHTFAGAPWHVAHAHEVREAERSGAPTLLWGDHLRMAADSPSVTASYAVLGWNGAVVPLNGAALDSIGLAYPLAAHSERVGGGRVGHDKQLPATWLAADRGDPADLPPGLDPARVTAARRALRCGALAELRSATRDPLTPGRFLRNVAGSWERTTFRFPDDPMAAERELCGGR
ncbi:hypothetical protein [Streptomyces sp. NBC_00996]|uniref:hypothetical protein n=1 Tax=Streptomyces sp. NBC_00996 TaxID=2903710 RepID=UPI00386F3CD3|nr:hypothetical protein OG390_18670 [Streptomyces sp. NBC_00996]